MLLALVGWDTTKPIPLGNSANEIQIVEAGIEKAFRLVKLGDGWVQPTPVWKDLASTWTNLISENQQIAQAKALCRFYVKPNDVGTRWWDARYEDAGKRWSLEETYQQFFKRLRESLGVFAIGFCSLLGALLMCSWIWQFFLRRIREVADAARGTGR